MENDYYMKFINIRNCQWDGNSPLWITDIGNELKHSKPRISSNNSTSENCDMKVLKIIEEPIIIKKYQNRKLYNTDTNEYVRLSEILDLVKTSERPVQVFDNTTKEDITLNVLQSLLLLLDVSKEDILEFIKIQS